MHAGIFSVTSKYFMKFYCGFIFDFHVSPSSFCAQVPNVFLHFLYLEKINFSCVDFIGRSPVEEVNLSVNFSISFKAAFEKNRQRFFLNTV